MKIMSHRLKISTRWSWMSLGKKNTKMISRSRFPNTRNPFKCRPKDKSIWSIFWGRKRQSGSTLKLSMSSCTCNSKYLISKSSIRELCSKSLPSWFIRLTAVEMSSLDRVKWQIACSLSSQASVSSTTRMKCWLSYSSQPPLGKPRSPLPSPSSEPSAALPWLMTCRCWN